MAVYAHPYYPKSSFVLNKYLIISSSKNYDAHDSESNENSELFFDSQVLENAEERPASRTSTYQDAYQKNDNYDGQDDMFVDHFADEDDNEHESIIWNIFLHLLKFIAEILL